MQGFSANIFRGLSIILLTVIAYMLIDSLFDIPLVALILCAVSGALIVFACKQIDRSELNAFRAILVMGLVFFVIGNIIVLTQREQYLYYIEPTMLYLVTLGFFLSAVGTIFMISSIPLIIYKDLQENFRRKQLA